MNALDYNEVWLTCKDWPDYMVSNFGRVMRVTAGRGAAPGVVKKVTVDPKGYPVVSMRNKGVRKGRTLNVHALVATAFLQKPEGRVEVNHIDGNPLNNFWRNLEWVTHAENMRHASVTGLKGIIKPEDVPVIRRRAAAGELHYKMAAEYGVCDGTIHSLVSGKSWKHIPLERSV